MQGSDYDDPYEIRVNPGYGRKRFSSQELTDILVSMLVLTVAFMILRRGIASDSYLVSQFGETGTWVFLFLLCLVTVIVSFLLHEFGHKFTAQKYGMWSEYRMYPAGLLLTLVTSLFGFLFAAPGAVYIRGYADVEKNGRISMAGPIVNIVLAAISLVVVAFITSSTSLGDGYWVMSGGEYIVLMVFSMLLSLNAFLAVFNLLPIPPLDGSKILPWNKVVWVVMFIISVVEIVYYFLCMPEGTIWITG